MAVLNSCKCQIEIAAAITTITTMMIELLQIQVKEEAFLMFLKILWILKYIINL
jgi:hypothetical protein